MLGNYKYNEANNRIKYADGGVGEIMGEKGKVVNRIMIPRMSKF